jgi:hypothetical protein
MSRESNYAYFPAVALTAGVSCCRAHNIGQRTSITVGLRAGGNNHALNLADYFRANNMKYTEMKFPGLEEVPKFETGVIPLPPTSPSSMRSVEPYQPTTTSFCQTHLQKGRRPRGAAATTTG